MATEAAPVNRTKWRAPAYRRYFLGVASCHPPEKLRLDHRSTT